MSSRPSARHSLRRQLLLWLLIPLILILAVNSVLAYRVALKTANDAYDRLLLTSVRAVAERVGVTNGEITVDLPYVALELFESNIKEHIYYKVSGPGGKTITGYEDLPPPPTKPAVSDQPVFYQAQYQGGTLYLAALYKQIYDPEVHGSVLIQVGETAESREALSRQILIDGLVRQGLLIAVAALVVWFGLQRGLEPLLRLRDGVAGRSPTDLTPIDDSHIQDEVKPLIHAINLHTARVNSLIAARQRFIADASHQLRMPLAVLKTQAEYGLRQQSQAPVQAVLDDMRSTTDQTTRLVNQLLTLARAEPSALAAEELALVDLASLARATASEWVPAARRKRIDLGYDGEEKDALTVRGNPLLLRELIANLIDNAIRYTPQEGRVTVRLAAADKSIVLEVEDNGPGIPAAERERVFERFYRGKTASAEGSGLGLAIVQDICRSHQAAVALSEPPSGHGLLVRVRFPRTPTNTSE